jgi:hypothetical protein
VIITVSGLFGLAIIMVSTIASVATISVLLRLFG